MDFICWGSFLPLSWTMLKIIIQVRQQIDHLLVIFQWTNRFHYSKRFHHDLITNNQEIFWAFFIWELWSPRKVVKEIGQFAATVRSLLLLHSLSSITSKLLLLTSTQVNRLSPQHVVHIPEPTGITCYDPAKFSCENFHWVQGFHPPI